MNDKPKEAPKGVANNQELRKDKTASVAASRIPESQQDAGLFSKISGRFNSAMQANRGGGGGMASQPLPQRPTEEVSIARIRSSKGQKMYIPEGVVIAGSITGGLETEIHGRVEGNVSVDATLILGKNAVITGDVHAGSCQVDGTVKGVIKCTDDLVVAATGRLASDALAGKQIRVAGSIEGNVNTPGVLRIEAGGVVNGDVQARVFSMSEGAELNGRCSMRAQDQQETLFSPQAKGENR